VPHELVVPGVQVPVPSQVAAVIWLPPEQEAGTQTAPAVYFWQPPAPSQRPSVPQPATPVSEHWPLELAPAWARSHVPSEPEPFLAAVHAMQVAVHTVLQQTPSAQWSLVHSAGPAHTEPFAFVAAWHMPEMQFWPPVHALVQDPQCALSLAVLASQPLSGLPSQSAYPAAQEGMHAPPEHAVVPCALVHATLHPPQWATSFWTSTQLVPHVSLGGAQGAPPVPVDELVALAPVPVVDELVVPPVDDDAVPPPVPLEDALADAELPPPWPGT
jgi:hypothetical protein